MPISIVLHSTNTYIYVLLYIHMYVFLYNMSFIYMRSMNMIIFGSPYIYVPWPRRRCSRANRLGDKMAAGKVVILIYLALVWYHVTQGLRLDWNNVEKTMAYGILQRIYPGKPVYHAFFAMMQQFYICVASYSY